MRASKRNYKKEYKKFQSSPEMIKYRTRLNKENRDRGTYGNGDGMDVSHKGKTTVLEKQSVNRGRMGEGGRKRKVSVKKRRAKQGMIVKKTPKYNLGGMTQNDEILMNQIMGESVDPEKEPKKEKVRFVDRLKSFLNKRKQEKTEPMKPIKSKTVEEIPDALPRTEREQREQNLQIASADMAGKLINPGLLPLSVNELMYKNYMDTPRSETGDPDREGAKKEHEILATQAIDRREAFRTERDPIARDYIENDLFPSVGLMNRDSTKDAWSAATVSKLAKAFDPSFEGSGNHGNYINRAFNNKSGIGYTAQPIEKNTQFRVGDILFQGRLKEEKDKDGNKTGKMIPAGPQEYKGFEKAARGKGKWADGYGSHTDIIVDVVRRGDETYYVVQGGNISGKMKLKELSAAQLVAQYEGRLTQ